MIHQQKKSSLQKSQSFTFCTKITFTTPILQLVLLQIESRQAQKMYKLNFSHVDSSIKDDIL